jgi:phage gp29-like protein
MPWVVGKAAKGAEPKDKQDMAASMARMVRDCVAVIPAGAEVAFMTPGTTQHTLHEQFIARQDKAISKLLMGQTLTVEMEGRNNSQAAATTHEDVAEGLAASDKAMVADAMNEIAWLYARVNAGPEVLAPLFAFEEPEDLNARADLDKKLFDMEVEWLPQHFKDNYNLKPGEFRMRAKPEPADPAGDVDADPEADPDKKADGAGEEPDAGGAEDAPGDDKAKEDGKEKKEKKPASFAAASGRKTSPASTLAEKAQEHLDAAVKRLLPDALKANDEFVTRLENAIKGADSFDAAELALVELLAPRTSPSALEDLLARAMTAAAGFGATAERVEIGKGGE